MSAEAGVPLPSMDVAWSQVLFHLGQLAIAWVLSLPVAWDRELESRGAGLRTFPLVAVAFSRYEVALVMALINFVTLRYVQRFKQDETDVGKVDG